MGTFTSALYYPTIDITNEGWLKNSILYWDKINTIVPQSILNPYQTETSRVLEYNGILEPLFVNPNSSEVIAIVPEVIKWLDSEEGINILADDGVICADKLPEEILDILHIEKWSDELGEILRNKIENQSMKVFDQSWNSADTVRVSKKFASYYMTLLANKLSETRGLSLLTNLSLPSQFTDSIRLDSKLNLSNLQKTHPRNRSFYNQNHFMNEMKSPEELKQGILATLVFKNIWINPETPIDTILKFKEKYSDELGLFRNKIIELTTSINEAPTLENLIQQIESIYKNKFQPEMNNVQKALNSNSIKSVIDNLFKVSLISVPATSIPLYLGLNTPQALLASATVSLVASLCLYNLEKAETLRNNPYTYLIKAEEEFY